MDMINEQETIVEEKRGTEGRMGVEGQEINVSDDAKSNLLSSTTLGR